MLSLAELVRAALGGLFFLVASFGLMIGFVQVMFSGRTGNGLIGLAIIVLLLAMVGALAVGLTISGDVAVIDMAEVRLAARLILRLWPYMDPDDAESCAGEAAAQVGTDARTLLQAVAKRRAVDLYRTFYATSRRGRPLTDVTASLDAHAVFVNTIPDSDDSFVDRIAEIDFARWAVDQLSERDQFVVRATAAGQPLRVIGEHFGVTDSMACHIRKSIQRRAQSKEAA